MGSHLLQTVINATDLPEQAVEKELHLLLTNAGFDKDLLTLEDLREAMAQYLQTVFLELAENESSFNQVS